MTGGTLGEVAGKAREAEGPAVVRREVAKSSLTVLWGLSGVFVSLKQNKHVNVTWYHSWAYQSWLALQKSRRGQTMKAGRIGGDCAF
jgi:hypothetical protein